MATEFEKLAYETALRALDKQEGLLEELRARTGVLVAAAAIAASLLGPRAFQNPSPKGLAVTALVAFVIALGASVFVLLPKKRLVFAASGTGIYEGFYALRKDMSRVYRHLTYDLQAFWETNEEEMLWLSRVFTLAAAAMVIEILALASMLSDTIF
jgi:hypothetical protein